MSDLISRQAAIDALSAIEVSKMEHCVGFDRKKIYLRGKMAYFKPYRNYYDAGGTDVKEDLLIVRSRKRTAVSITG